MNKILVLFVLVLLPFAACKAPCPAPSPSIPPVPADPNYSSIDPEDMRKLTGPDDGTVSEGQRWSFFIDSLKKNKWDTTGQEWGTWENEEFPPIEEVPYCYRAFPYHEQVCRPRFPMNTLFYGGLGAVIGHQYGHRGEGAVWGALYGMMLDSIYR